MKNLKYIGCSLLFVLGLVSCNDWLDVNDNPNTPTQSEASVASRLPWIQHHCAYAYGSAGMRGGYMTGMITSVSDASTSSTNMHNYMPFWDPINGISTTPYQHWFVGAAANLEDLIRAAEEEGAYHYIAAARTIYAYGYMLMVDWYGEMPYYQALGDYLTPKYDDGKTIFNGCLADLDEALKYFEMTQEAGATPLKDGDSWNDGDVEKWKAFIYGLKARWLNNLSKKSSYDPQAILAALEKAPTSNSMNTVIDHVNETSDTSGDVLAGDPLKTSYLFDSAAWSDHIRLTKYYTDMFEYPQADGTVVFDPRREKMLPMNRHHIDSTYYVDVAIHDPHFKMYISGKDTLYFMVTHGVDVVNTEILLEGGPRTQVYDADTKQYSVSAEGREGDTIFVTLKGVCCAQGGQPDETFYQSTDGTILSTGTYYTRPEAPTDVLCYPEMCFIKAEVYFRLGEKGLALAAYKEGVAAHLEMMNDKLASYGTANNPGKLPMDPDEIADFLASDCLAQTADELTMAEIMKQKFIAMTFTQQAWNDVRRFNYSAGNIADFGVVYPGLERPTGMRATAATTKFPGTSKTDENYWWRRMAQCSHEVNYNAVELGKSNPKAFHQDIWTVPVWWDTAEE
ncbi:MAG: SusD/RagB family nutrient-binding outer membrane lipoprotein [Bacteroides sp.]|nr:SusD/RagB family nutrient-binding outer membrane lipoprotein [Bacteroides sp.]